MLRNALILAGELLAAIVWAALVLALLIIL